MIIQLQQKEDSVSEGRIYQICLTFSYLYSLFMPLYNYNSLSSILINLVQYLIVS